MRNTNQRTAILEEICRRKDHPTAYEIYDTVRVSLPNISLGTVYRNLDVLSGKGLVRRIDNGGDQKRFDAVTEDHPHFRCLNCGRVEDVPMDRMPDFHQTIGPWLEERLVSEINLEFTGLCPSCRKKKKE